MVEQLWRLGSLGEQKGGRGCQQRSNKALKAKGEFGEPEKWFATGEGAGVSDVQGQHLGWAGAGRGEEVDVIGRGVEDGVGHWANPLCC